MQASIPTSKRKLLTNICTKCVRRLNQQHSPLLGSSLLASSRGPLRSLHTSHNLLDQQPHQAQPLGSYYESLLSTPIPPPTTSSLPTFVPSGDLTKEQRAARVFGSISGSGYEHHTSPTSTWQKINGVAVPPRPGEPDNCCMSGCVHCVWDDYRDDIEQWAGRVREAQAKGQSDDRTTPKVYTNRPEVQVLSASMDDDGCGSEALWDAPGGKSGTSDLGEELFQGIPVGIREFMATEKRIRERKKARRRS
jgi:hypothetical protein